MIEIAVVIDKDGEALHWHAPPGRTSVAIPDTRQLWNVLWEHRLRIRGVAHTHPGTGSPVPSWEDLTTFAGVEAGLGVRLTWWIATRDHLATYSWAGPGKYDYEATSVVSDTEDEEPRLGVGWVARLRELSYHKHLEVRHD